MVLELKSTSGIWGGGEAMSQDPAAVQCRSWQRSSV